MDPLHLPDRAAPAAGGPHAGARPAIAARAPARAAAALAVALALALAGAAAAQPAAPASAAPVEPEVGQAGKDVIWIPTPQALVDAMLDMAKVGADDVVIDLGSGDGRLVISAARRGARALGVDLDANLVALARQRAEREGLAGRARFERRDLFTQDLSEATVVTMFLLTEINLKLRPRLLALRPGTRLVSNTFDMGAWQPDETRTVGRESPCEHGWCTALMWIVPAKVGRTQRAPDGDLVLAQSFQRLTGTLRGPAGRVPVTGTVRGDEVTLQAGERTLRGTVRAGRIEFR